MDERTGSKEDHDVPTEKRGEGRIGVYRNGELYKPNLYSRRIMSIAIESSQSVSQSVSSESGGDAG
jgi:hypothetical protein